MRIRSVFGALFSRPTSLSVNFSFVLLFIALALFAQPALAQAGGDVRTLELEKSVERELAGGGSHQYQITLLPGQLVRVVAEQRGIDVVLALFAPDGKQLLEVDSPNGEQGPELLGWVTTAVGSYRIEVRSLEKGAAAGRYAIKLSELRPATEQDHVLLQADQLNADAEKLGNEGKYDQAIVSAERALALREKTLGAGHRDIATAIEKLADLYKNKNDYDRAESLYQRALAILEKAAPPDNSNISLLLTKLALTYDQKGDYAKAEPLQQRVLEMTEKSLGKDHPFVAVVLSNLATMNLRVGNYAKAELLLARALAIREKTLGAEHPNVATTLSSLADVSYYKGDYNRAEAFYSRALAIVEKAVGTETPNAALILNNLVNVYSAKGEYAKAEPLQQRVLAMLQKLLGAENPSVATALNNLANINQNLGNYAKAETLLQRALAMREKTLGAEHPEVAITLNNLAYLYDSTGEYAKSEKLYNRALMIAEKRLGANHPDVATALSNLGSLYQKKGEYDKSEQLYQRALSVREQALGANHPDVALSLGNLGGLFQDRGDYIKSEQLYLRALEIWERALGPENPDLARALNNLASTYNSRGDYVQAETLYKRALAIREKALGPEHPNVATSLNNLAFLYNDKDEFDKSLPLLQRALAIWEKALGTKHPDVALALNNLAAIYERKKDFDAALPLHQRALAIREKAFGAQHPDVANSLNNLAVLYFNKGDFAAAEPLAARALAIWEQAFGPDHPAVANALNNLMTINDRKGDYGQAVGYAARAGEIIERNLALNLTAGSERQRLAYLTTYARDFDRYVTLHLRHAPTDAGARDLAISTILRSKGRVLDATADSLSALRRRATPQDQALLDELKETNNQLAQFALNSQQQVTPERRKRLKDLEARKEQLEAEASRRSAEFRAQSRPVTLAAVKAAIPADAALVEFFVYRPFNAQATAGDRYGSGRYVAYVVRRQGAAQWVELGEQQAIDAGIAKLRAALRDRRRSDVKLLARAVDEKVMRPVRRLLGQTTKVFLAPDGALNLLPFAALADETGRYLIERYSFSYLTSGRDLLRLEIKTPNKQTALVVANPDFGEGAKDGAAQERILKYRPGAKASTGESTPLSEFYFPPLKGTADEATALKAMMTDAKILTQAQATEAALKQISSPRILHIATHGFFLDGQSSSTGEGRLLRPVSGANAASSRTENPLLRSGLALAGANSQKGGDGEDGILTAQEAAGLDLWGTKLVVLSACDTGVGEIKTGEGVYGLRRALVLAGSETQVMSLWPVSDAGTRDLMIGYYKRLLAGKGRTEALRQTQLELLSRKNQNADPANRILKRKGMADETMKSRRTLDYSHPYYWASFIQSGEWANLEGRR